MKKPEILCTCFSEMPHGTTELYIFSKYGMSVTAFVQELERAARQQNKNLEKQEELK